jgi:hypothetical protein
VSRPLEEVLRERLGCQCVRLDDMWHHERFCPVPVAAQTVDEWLAEQRETVADRFSAPEHAPMSDHDPRTGECVSCPWPARQVLSDVELADAALGAVRGRISGGGR